MGLQLRQDDLGGTSGIGCVSLGPGPGELRRSIEHVYAEPGTYEATFTLAGCGPDSTDASVTLPVTVEP